MRSFLLKTKVIVVLQIYLLLGSLSVAAQSFSDLFTEQTLRLDYIFSGNKKMQMIALDKLNSMPGWYGKRQRLDEVPVEGNGQIIVKLHKSDSVIYRNSFSTLFQEWLTYDEAEKTTKSFENVFLIPMPRKTVDVSIELYDNHRKKTATMTHTVDPNDILIHRIGETTTPYITLNAAADTTRCIHIAYLAEGYTEEEMDSFINDATIAMETLLSYEPFKSMRDKFNIIAVKSLSKESGTSEPSKGIWKNTALNSHFDTFYSDRYLTTLNLKAMHDWLAGTPYEHIIVLVNTEKYGGGGILNSYNLSMTHHKMFKPVVVHEFGHSFAGLADEYAYEQEDLQMYPHDIEPWEPNITTLVDFESKWKDMIDGKVENVGLYEGAGYSIKGVYRPCADCRMRTNENPDFCPVCQRALKRLINFYAE